MALSPKQLAFGWINRCLEPENIDPERHELEALNGGPISNKLMDDAKGFVHEELQKLKAKKYQPYVDKYIHGKEVTNAPEENEDN